MVIDSSAVVAILTDEPEADVFISAIDADPVRLLSVATFLETAMVIEARYGAPGGDKLDEFINVSKIELAAVTPEQAAVARTAFRTFGKGRHPASLNFGTAFRMPLPRLPGNHYCAKGTTLLKPISCSSFPHNALLPYRFSSDPTASGDSFTRS